MNRISLRFQSHLKPTRLIFFVIFIIPFTLFSQKGQQNLEEKAARYFSKQNWEKLIDLGEKALKDGKTFEDLHYRLGIAFYRNENYWESIAHLEKVSGAHLEEKIFQKYLINSYRYANRKEDAYYAGRNFSDSLKKELGLKIEKPIDLIRLAAGLKKSSIPDSIDHMFFGSVEAEHQVNSQLRIAHAIALKKQTYLRNDFNQFQYYIRAEYTISKGFTLLPAFHYLHFQAERPIPDGLGGFIGGYYTDISQNGFAGFLGARKSFGRLQVMPFIALSRLKTEATNYPISIDNTGPVIEIILGEDTFEEEQFQVGSEFNYVFPFLDNNWQFGGEIQYHRNSIEENILWKINSQFQVNPKASLHLEYFKGGVLNFLENKAADFNNIYSPIDKRISARLDWQIFDETKLALNYQRVIKSERYFNFTYDVFLIRVEFGL